jgi:hypothetical protein
MSDQQIIQHPSGAVHAVGVRWLPIITVADSKEALHFGRLLERADVPHVIDEADTSEEGQPKPADKLTVSVQECHYERACEIIAREHAVLIDSTDDGGGDLLDDDDDAEEDLDDEDDVFLDDDIDDEFDDDEDDLIDDDPDDT